MGWGNKKEMAGGMLPPATPWEKSKMFLPLFATRTPCEVSIAVGRVTHQGEGMFRRLKGHPLFIPPGQSGKIE